MILLGVKNRGRNNITYDEMYHYSTGGELFGAVWGNSREHTTGVLLDENKFHQEAMNLERERAGVLTPPVIPDGATRYSGPLPGMQEYYEKIQAANPRLNREDIKKIIPDYPDEMADNISEVRAELLMEVHRKRKARDEIIARAEPSFKSTAMNLGVSLVSGALDPINFIPFGGAMARASQVRKIASMSGIQFVARGTGRGAVEGAVGNAVVEAMAYPWLNATGANLGLGDFAADVAFGGLIGGFFGGAGTLLGQRRYNVHHAAMADHSHAIMNGEIGQSAKYYAANGISYNDAIVHNPTFRTEIDRLTEEFSGGGGIECTIPL